MISMSLSGVWLCLPGRHLGDLSDGTNEAGNDEKRDEDFEKEETSHQKRVKHRHKGTNAFWVKAVDARLKMKNPDYGKYRNKSNEIPLQLHDWKSIFPVTIALIQIVIEFLSNYILSTVIVSKYFPYSKIVIDYLSKYMVSYNSKPFKLNCYISVIIWVLLSEYTSVLLTEFLLAVITFDMQTNFYLLSQLITMRSS